MPQHANPDQPRHDVSSPHPLKLCWDLQLAGLGADALQVALEYALFNHLSAPVSAPALASNLALDATSTGYLLELLWSLGLLDRDSQQPPRYCNLPLANLYLRSGASTYCGDALLFRHRVMRQSGAQLGDNLKNGAPRPPATSAAIANAWAEAARVQIAQEQRAVTNDVACALVESLPEAPHLERLLDLGGGPGLVAIALAGHLPNLTGIVFDYPSTADVARENIRSAGLDHRLEAVGGDLNDDDFGGGYDLIWCSSVLHFVHDLPATLHRLLAALKPGGVLLCCQAEVPDERKTAAQVLPYYLNMRLQGRHMLNEGELARTLEDIGFQSVQQLPGLRFPVTSVNAVIARRPRE